MNVQKPEEAGSFGGGFFFSPNLNFRQLGLYFTSSMSNYASLAIIRDERNCGRYEVSLTSVALVLARIMIKE